MSKNTEALLQDVDKFIEKLDQIWSDARAANSSEQFGSRRARWKDRCRNWISTNISEKDADRFDNADYIGVYGLGGDDWYYPKIKYQGLKEFLIGLRADIADNPEDYERSEGEKFFEIPVENIKPAIASDKIFVVHGHDDANLAQLCKMLKERFGLKPIVLKEKPGKSRTIIEKFEEEAERAAFALALLSPDDMVKTEKGNYAQARPNVVFELGWFFARLGRSNVRIMLKKGTQIHSDLDGIERIEFHESVEETLIQLERELEAGGYDKSKKAFVR